MDVDIVEVLLLGIEVEEELPEGGEVEIGVGEEKESDFGFRVDSAEAGDGAGRTEGGEGGSPEKGEVV